MSKEDMEELARLRNLLDAQKAAQLAMRINISANTASISDAFKGIQEALNPFRTPQTQIKKVVEVVRLHRSPCVFCGVEAGFVEESVRWFCGNCDSHRVQGTAFTPTCSHFNLQTTYNGRTTEMDTVCITCNAAWDFTGVEAVKVRLLSGLHPSVNPNTSIRFNHT